MPKNLLLLFVLLSISISTYAQRSCVAHDLMLQQNADPVISNQRQQIEKDIEDFIANYEVNPLERAIITIPIVFHVIHNGDALGSNENIPDAQIMDQLDQLNLDFSAANTDFGNTPSVFQNVAANSEIQFCLAKVDPNGNPTTGINRYNEGSATWSMTQFDNNVKPGTIWDSSCYLNFWIGNLSNGLLGYAQFPGGAANTDGVVCLYSSVGSMNNPAPGGSPYDLGRTATHEIGHWLNLRHIWGDANCGNDLVADTPTQQTSNGGCPAFPQVTCGNGPNGDMHMNYMDYVYDACMYMFSEGQKARMIASLNTSRSAMINDGCGVCVTPTCIDGIQNGDETGIDCGGATCPTCPPSCTDGIMNQDETDIDCGGTICPTCPACGGIPLTCGTPYSGDTDGAGNDYVAYNGTDSSYPGEDILFEYLHPTTGPITITLSNISRNVDMIIMDGCDVATANIIAEVRNNGTTNEVYTNANLAAGDYFIHIDSRNARRTATFTLEVTPCPPAGVLLSPKVFLQGPLAGSTMNVALTGTLPTTSPYADAKPLSGAAPANTIDWIWVELRSDNTAAPATTDGQSGILLNDGTVVDVDGMPLKFNVTPGQSWFIMVQHRNHLGMMTNSAILLN